MDEFDFISQHLRPLATAPEAHSLSDDGVSLPPLPPDSEWRITTDTMLEGMHFPENASWKTRLRRLFAANVSDLNAQLAKPTFYTLNLSLKSGFDAEVLAEELAACQSHFGLSLLGGDTTQTSGPDVLSMTAFGLGALGQNPVRSRAHLGDRIYLLPAQHGSLGAAKAGFEGDEQYHAAYFCPEPPEMNWVETDGAKIHAMADVSDGVLQDLGHICKASGLAADVYLDALPVALPDQPKLPQLTWGDDYALILTASEPLIIEGLIEIGRMTAGQGVKLLDASGREIPVEQAGYKHL